VSQKYLDITKYHDIIVWDHVTIANSNIKIKMQERQVKNGEKTTRSVLIIRNKEGKRRKKKGNTR